LPVANFLAGKNLTDTAESMWPQSPYRGRQRVSSSSDEVPHIFTQKSRVQPKEILIVGPKRLFQQHRPLTTKLQRDKFQLIVVQWHASRSQMPDSPSPS
jgi:hypothetical protein